MFTKKRLLIWGKTYPEFSRKYRETVCTGAVDEDTGRLVRIYPLRLRLRGDRVSLYDWIEAEIERNDEDFRPESHRIREDTITVVGHLDTNDEWRERSSWVLRPGNVFASVEALREAELRDHTSFGLVKPRCVRRVYAKDKSPDERAEWDEARDRAMAQRELFAEDENQIRRGDLEFIPAEYRVEFDCDDPRCTGHNCSVLDWGLGQLHRRQAEKKGYEAAKADVVAKIEECLDSTRKNAHLFLGNTKAHTQNFMIVGLYYPPLPKPTPPPKAKRVPPSDAGQGSLF